MGSWPAPITICASLSPCAHRHWQLCGDPLFALRIAHDGTSTARHASASLRPTFSEALPLLESVLDNLPAGVPSSRGFGCGGGPGGGMPMDSLDALDSMMTAGLSLKARR